jgi:hypothetical protein
MPKKREGENFENESIEIMTEDSPWALKGRKRGKWSRIDEWSDGWNWGK